MTIRLFIARILAIWLLAAIAGGCSRQQMQQEDETQGTLFIMGGGEREDSLMQIMLAAADWKNGPFITVITLPSTWDSTFLVISEQLQRLSGRHCVRFDSAALHQTARLDSLSQSGVIFISGGDQSRMMRLIAGTSVADRIRTAYRAGAVIGGTSAGASVMSRRMITGNQLRDTVYQPTFPVLQHQNIDLQPGLGLLDSVIIDQHFVVRSRYNRLLSALLDNPDYQCVGIDENTALLVQGRLARVVGESQVVVLRRPMGIHRGPNGLLGVDDVWLSVLLPGQSFEILP